MRAWQVLRQRWLGHVGSLSSAHLRAKQSPRVRWNCNTCTTTQSTMPSTRPRCSAAHAQLVLLATAALASLVVVTANDSGSGAGAFIADASIFAQIRDDEHWLAPALPWAASSLRASSKLATRVDAVIEGIANTIVDANETHVVERTVVQLLSSGEVAEVDLPDGANNYDGTAMSARRFVGQHVKWVVAHASVNGSFGLLTRASGRESSGNR